MKYFLAITPPSELAQQITAFCTPWGLARIAPHITVKAPNSLGDLWHWLPQVEALCQQVAPFEVAVSGIGQFGNSVLYLAVASAPLVRLHHSFLRIINPTEAEQIDFFEGPRYQPHITLAHTGSGLSADDLLTMAPLAHAQWPHPFRFLATSLVVYQSAANGQSYQEYQVLPFTGMRSA